MTSTYLLSWKLAEVIPLHKDGDPDNAPNNRPVSVLSSLSKICDKVALNQFTDYLMEHKLLMKHQSGNRKLHSTETLSIAVTDILLEAIDKKQLSIIIFLDLSKAFDSVQHDILLKKIMDLGVTSEVLNWFKSYLSNRSQYVRIGTATSTCAALEHGIPQGSVLSPFLFNPRADFAPCEGTNSPRLFTPRETKALAKSKVHQLSRAWVTNDVGVLGGWSSSLI
jgi:hypothetical protein